jgi:hypothetical protein
LCCFVTGNSNSWEIIVNNAMEWNACGIPIIKPTRCTDFSNLFFD